MFFLHHFIMFTLIGKHPYSLQFASPQDGDQLAFDAFQGNRSQDPAVCRIYAVIAEYKHTSVRNLIGVLQFTQGICRKYNASALGNPVDHQGSAVAEHHHISCDGYDSPEGSLPVGPVGNDIICDHLLPEEFLCFLPVYHAQISVSHCREHILSAALRNQEAEGEYQIAYHCQIDQANHKLAVARPGNYARSSTRNYLLDACLTRYLYSPFRLSLSYDRQ